VEANGAVIIDNLWGCGMNVEPFEWNVVVVGYWNPAILTPSGIAKRVFGLDDGSPISVEVPMDGMAPPRVRSDSLIVTAEPGRLMINTDPPSLRNLDQARKAAVKAISSLPETPLTAAGFNIRLKLDSLPSKLTDAIEISGDNLLADAGYRIESSSIRRSLACGQGHINLAVHNGSVDDIKIDINFHRQSSVNSELQEWLEMSSTDVENSCGKILKTWVGIKFEEEWR
jgi:hypothetical protein